MEPNHVHFIIGVVWLDEHDVCQPVDPPKTVQKDADQQQAFEREFAYVQAEKRGLETQLKTLKTQNAQVVSTLENTIVSLEGKLATGKTDLIAKNEQFLQLEKRVASIQDEDASLRATLEQAQYLLMSQCLMLRLLNSSPYCLPKCSRKLIPGVQ